MHLVGYTRCIRMETETMNHYHILANSSEEQVSQLASRLLEQYPTSQIKLLSGPRQGLVMLRVRETVAESLFNAGEVLVTEVKLELNGQFGFGLVMGNQPRKPLPIAPLNTPLRKNNALPPYPPPTLLLPH